MNFQVLGMSRLSETCRGERSGVTAQRVNLLRRRGATNRAGRAIVDSSRRRQNLDRDAAAELVAPVAVPSEKEACRTAFAVDMHVDGFW